MERNPQKTRGKVYTPEKLVTQILDLAGYYGEAILDKRIMENSCGDGAFLAQIVDRYCRVADARAMTPRELRERLERHIYGIELDKDELRKCRARLDEIGIIPGSMGTASYIVRGLGNPESFMSCSHGAGRVMSRMAASIHLTVEECDAAMAGIVFERWSKCKFRRDRYDLSEAPQAYKPIDDVIAAEADLVEPLVRLTPLAVLKG